MEETNNRTVFHLPTAEDYPNGIMVFTMQENAENKPTFFMRLLNPYTLKKNKKSEVRMCKSGRGVFALEDIAKGDIILMETPGMVIEDKLKTTPMEYKDSVKKTGHGECVLYNHFNNYVIAKGGTYFLVHHISTKKHLKSM